MDDCAACKEIAKILENSAVSLHKMMMKTIKADLAQDDLELLLRLQQTFYQLHDAISKNKRSPLLE